MPTLETVNIISLIASVLLFVAGIFKPVFMPLSYMVCLYSNLPYHFKFLYEIRYEPIIAIAGFIRVLVAKDALKRISIRYDKINLYLFYFVLTIALSFSLAMNYKTSWEGTIYDFIGVLLLYMMMLMSVNDEKNIRIFIWGYILVFAFLAYEPFYYYFTGNKIAFAKLEQYGTVYKGRVGFLSGHVAMGNNMNQMIPIALFAMMSIRSKLLKIPAAIPLVIFFTGLLITKSRGGVVGFMFLIALLVYFSKNRWRNGIIGGFLILLLLVTSGDFLSTLGRISSGAAEGRLQGFYHGVEMLLKGRIFGVGPGCYSFARGYYFGYTLEAHNVYGEIIGDLGIPGAIAACFLLWRVIKNNVEILSKLKTANNERSFLYYTTMGIHISLLLRLFVSLASHGIYIFHWYFVAATSIIIGKLTLNLSERNATDNKMIEPIKKIK